MCADISMTDYQLGSALVRPGREISPLRERPIFYGFRGKPIDPKKRLEGEIEDHSKRQ
jgi:hypothetical protein